MSGYDSPQQYDMTLVAELRRPSSVDAIKVAIDRMMAQGQISEESKRGFASRETTCRSLELSMCRRMPSSTSQVIDASSPLGDML